MHLPDLPPISSPSGPTLAAAALAVLLVALAPIVVAGVAQVTFGASVWLVVLTIALVSAMYRLVMIWVIDGSGGSGLNEITTGQISSGHHFLLPGWDVRVGGMDYPIVIKSSSWHNAKFRDSRVIFAC